MSNQRRRGSDHINIPLQGRTFARSQGCYNCKHWENGEKARGFWDQSKKRDLDLATAHEVGDPIRGRNNPQAMQIRKNVADANKMLRTGHFGICLKGQTKSDFVQHSYLCGGWDGRDGASVARAGGALDPLPEDLKAKLD